MSHFSSEQTMRATAGKSDFSKTARLSIAEKAKEAGWLAGLSRCHR